MLISMESITFRQLTKKDFQPVHDLALKGWYFAYSHLRKEDLKKLVDAYYTPDILEKSVAAIASGKEFFLLAHERKKLVGFCHVAIREKQGELCRLYIEPDLIGKGLGKKLLLAGEEFLRSQGIKSYFTFTNRHNKTGTDFYLRNGFVHVPEKDKDDEFEKKVLWYLEKQIR
jgi:N-acetylglutamate synthase-like GNAT family acetyltransferase